MEHFLKIDEGIDVSEILYQLEGNPDLWGQYGLRKYAPNSPHREMTDIWVRYNDIRPFQAHGDYRKFNDEHVPIWYPAWDRIYALKPIIFNLMAKVRGEMIGGVLITKIPPGMGIKPHADDSWHVQYYEKFYLSLKSSKGSIFGCDHNGIREELNPKPGEIYLFDNRKLHWVENNSDEDRITLIICIRTEMFGRVSNGI